jgi:hypothetical protein
MCSNKIRFGQVAKVAKVTNLRPRRISAPPGPMSTAFPSAWPVPPSSPWPPWPHKGDNRQKARDADYASQHKTWVDSLPAEQRRNLIAMTKHLPILDPRTFPTV